MHWKCYLLHNDTTLMLVPTMLCIHFRLCHLLSPLTILFTSVFLSSCSGVCLGWICVHHQPDPTACLCAVAHWSLLQQSGCLLLHLLHLGVAYVHAGPICWVSTHQDQWTHGCCWYDCGVDHEIVVGRNGGGREVEMVCMLGGGGGWWSAKQLFKAFRKLMYSCTLCHNTMWVLILVPYTIL